MKLFPALLLVGLLGCARSPAASPPEAQQSQTSSEMTREACTLETPLVPGVPGSPGNLLPSELNPNGASELAALMRTMQRDLAAAKQAILRGESPEPMHERHRKIRCAWPTDPAERNAAFDAMAQAYLGEVRALDQKPSDLRAAHGRVVSACIACHETACSGPIPAIEALRLE